MFFQNYRLQNTWLCECLKSQVSGNPRTVDLSKGPKHCCNLQDSSFTSFFHDSGKILVGKSLSQ